MSWPENNKGGSFYVRLRRPFKDCHAYDVHARVKVVGYAADKLYLDKIPGCISLNEVVYRNEIEEGEHTTSEEAYLDDDGNMNTDIWLHIPLDNVAQIEEQRFEEKDDDSH